MQTMCFNNRCAGVILVAALVQACATNGAGDTSATGKSGYLAASTQDFVMSAQSKCVRTATWSSDTNVVECQASAPAPVTAAPKVVGSELVSFKGRALFEFDSFDISSEGRQQLDLLTSKLNRQDQITAIEIVGHTDSRGSDSYNLILSERRADSVKSYLEQSLQTVSVSSNGLGENAPIGDNATDDGRQLNRRVDVKIAALRER